MNKPNIIGAITLAVGVGAALALTVPAAASAAGGGSVAVHHGPLGPAGIRAGHGGGLGTSTPTSTRTFAGYETAVATDSATVATASFTVPTLTCTTTDRAIAPGVGIPVDKAKSASAAYVFAGCVSGAATYYPGLLLNGSETDYPSVPFAAGDVVNVIAKVSKNRTRVEVVDVTSGVTEKLIGSGASASDAFFGDAGWGTSTGALLHVPEFTKLTFKDCLLDGKALARWRPHAYQRVNSIGTVQIVAGGFWPGGTAFTTHFVHT
jgi:Peptidase A4 family